MKLTKTSKSLLLASSLLLAFAVWQNNAASDNCTGTTSACNDTQQNWVKWLSGNSRSTQFHFVDFLELVSQLLPAKSPKN
jgi:hypothetical protein